MGAALTHLDVAANGKRHTGIRNAGTGMLAFTDLTLGYDRHPAVHHLSGRIAKGTLLAVAGPNGAGKSTLLKSIAGVLRPLDGHIDRGGLDLRDIAYLPQAAEIDRSFPITVYDLVSMGVWREIGMFRGVNAALEARVAVAIEAVGLQGFQSRAIGTLSGGQMQRVLFARLLLQDAGVILLDEPFTAVDTRTTADLLAIIDTWHGEGRTVIAVLHDMAIIRDRFPQTLLLAREQVAWGPTAEALSEANLATARHMVEAFSSEAHICDKVA